MAFVGPMSSRQDVTAFSLASMRAIIGPELMYAIRPGKNGFPKCSA